MATETTDRVPTIRALRESSADLAKHSRDGELTCIVREGNRTWPDVLRELEACGVPELSDATGAVLSGPSIVIAHRDGRLTSVAAYVILGGD